LKPVGPKPLSIDEYRRRQQKAPSANLEIQQQKQKALPLKRLRGGILNNLKQEIGRLKWAIKINNKDSKSTTNLEKELEAAKQKLKKEKRLKKTLKNLF